MPDMTEERVALESWMVARGFWYSHDFRRWNGPDGLFIDDHEIVGLDLSYLDNLYKKMKADA